MCLFPMVREDLTFLARPLGKSDQIQNRDKMIEATLAEADHAHPNGNGNPLLYLDFDLRGQVSAITISPISAFKIRDEKAVPFAEYS